MRRITLFSFTFFFLLWALGRQVAPAGALDDQAAVSEVLISLGDAPQPHQPDLSIEGVSAEAGESLVRTGFSDKPGGGRTSKQSRHFVCTSCHNIQLEDPDLAVADPQARLEYAAANGLPFLQGTTLYGAVNRTSFYNGDYQKKYGELVKPARNNLREAIQLCAVECSQGRLLEPWELESVLAYLWTLELRVADLGLTQEERTRIDQALAGQGDKQAAIRLLKDQYLPGSPATFLTPPPDRKTGYAGLKGDPENGKLIYDLSCLHCHQGGRYAFFELDDSDYSFKYLDRHIDRYTRYSIYQVIRYGTSPLNGKRTYMPNYTREKLTDQQVEDLRAYIELRAGVGD